MSVVSPGVPSPRRVTVTPRGGLRIAASAPSAVVAAHPLVRALYPVVAQALEASADVLTVRDDLAGDVAVAFTALEVTVHLLGPGGGRSVPFAGLPAEPGESVTSVEIPEVLRRLDSGYLKVPGAVGPVAVAVVLRVRDGVVEEARVAVGGADGVPRRLSAVERRLLGARPSDALWAEAAARVVDEVPEQSGERAELLRRTVERQLRAVGGAGR
ncbi:FAD binding domain-containing protein [Streptomyces roseirectus]|uniref:FAD binding domain-containing protein n=1 Tax=Streptomyces roseirectus TaxID=2768066 RepID=A0A7H0I7B9_9ACTN|nr:FAD binding domain-containing protein [Streptomyces roseirectus]QNP68685.1 FAD binding domain-containing protein [Streptomyces roseirectus]